MFAIDVSRCPRCGSELEIIAAVLDPIQIARYLKHTILKAKAFYLTLNRANTFAIYFRITNAKKPETRQRWIERIINMLENGEVFH